MGSDVAQPSNDYLIPASQCELWHNFNMFWTLMLPGTLPDTPSSTFLCAPCLSTSASMVQPAQSLGASGSSRQSTLIPQESTSAAKSSEAVPAEDHVMSERDSALEQHSDTQKSLDAVNHDVQQLLSEQHNAHFSSREVLD